MRKFLIISLTVILFMSCAKDQHIAVKGLTAAVSGSDKKELTMKEEMRDSLKIVLTFVPYNPSNSNFTVESSNKELVAARRKANNDILLESFKIADRTAEKDSAYLYIKSEDGGFKDTIKVFVNLVATKVKKVTLDVTEKDMALNQTLQLTATIEPADATDKSITWISSNKNCATVSEDGLVTIVKGGEATITAKANGGNNKKATCKITVANNDYIDEYKVNHGEGVLIAGTTWAPVNCGYHAENYKFGKLYQWGRKDGQGYDYAESSEYKEEATIISDEEIKEASKAKATTYYTKWNETLAADDSWAKGPCPEGWVMPTKAQMEALIATSNSFNAENALVLGALVFPAAGNRDNTGVSASANREIIGNYWTVTPNAKNAEMLFFAYGEININAAARSKACAVRCVKEAK